LKPWLGTTLAAMVFTGLFGATETVFAGTIDTIRTNQMIRIGYRDDAPPFSYKKAGDTEPTGFMVNLCRAVAKKIGEQLSMPSLKVTYVAVTAANRFEAVQKQEVDLLCEPTSATLARRKLVDFSIPTFVDGAGIATTIADLGELKDLAGRKIGVVAGTTTEQALRRTLTTAGIEAEIVPAATHDEGLTMLDDGKISAYFADRSILMFLLQNSKALDKLRLAENYLSLEPYALALPLGDHEFRLAVDTALSRIYRSGDIISIFDETFGSKVKPTDMLKAVYAISGLPD